MLVLLLGVSPIVGNMVAAEFSLPDQWVPYLILGYVLLVALGVASEIRSDPANHRGLSDVNQVRAALLEQYREELRLLGLPGRKLLAIPWQYTSPVRVGKAGRLSRTSRAGRSKPQGQVVRSLAVEGTRGLILTGPSGSGKSVALMLSAIELAGEPGSTRLPLIVGLRSWRGSQTSTFDLAVEALVSRFTGRLTVPQAQEIVRTTSTSGDLILLLDELDELESERKVELLDNLRAHAVPFILSSEKTALEPTFAAFAEGFARLEILRVPLAAAIRYLRDSPSGEARRRLELLAQTWGHASGGDEVDSPFAEALSIGIIRDIIDNTDSASFDALVGEIATGSPDRVRGFLLRRYLADRTGLRGLDEADLRAVFLPSWGNAHSWWQMGDRVPAGLRVIIALVIGSVGGALALFSLPVAGASLGAAFLLVRALRSGRVPVVFSVWPTVWRSARLIPAAMLGALIGLGGLFALFPDLRLGGVQGEDAAAAPLWIQLSLGPALVIAHVLNSGLVLVGHRGRKDIAMRSSLFFGARSLIGGLILAVAAAICLGSWVAGWATASLLAAFGAAMAGSETIASGLRAVTPYVSFTTDRRNAWVQAVGFGGIIVAGCLAAFVPVSGLEGAVQAIALGAGAAIGNSVLSGSYGRWRLFTWPYLALRRGRPFLVWRTIERFHELGIIKYSGSEIQLRHNSLWSVLSPSKPIGGRP